MLKSSIDIHASVIRNDYFPDDLKAAEVTPTFKKNVDLEKESFTRQRSLKGSCY